MATCVSVNSTTDFTTSALAGPADGFSFSLIYATPAPTSTPAPTPTPTPSPTIAACITVGGSNNKFSNVALASPDNGFSFTVDEITGGGGAGALTGGGTCTARVAWPAYGVGNKYQVTWSAANVPQFFESDSTARTFYIDNGTNTMVRKGYSGACGMMSSANIIANQGVNGLATSPTFFSLEATSGSTFPLTLDVWIV
jgi:hypothetical protein